MSSLYSIGLMNELADALEVDRFTPEQVKRVISRGRLRGLKAVVEDRADIVFRSVLRRLYEGEVINIRRSTGIGSIARAKVTFRGYISSDFIDWGCDVPGEATDEQRVEVYEMVADGNFQTMFGSTGRPVEELVLTQMQIVAFCEDHRHKLRAEGFATFFLFKVGQKVLPDFSNLFVCVVVVGGRGLSAHVCQFSSSFVWLGESRRGVVLPQQTPKS